MIVVNWDGSEVPEELRNLPAGRYIVTPVDEVAELTPEEDAGLEGAITSLDEGRGLDHAEVMDRVSKTLSR
jgi:hypothetical protein